MKQAELLTARVEHAPASFVHCATRAVLGEPIDYGDCVNRPIRCVLCGLVIGEQSTRKDLTEAVDAD